MLNFIENLFHKNKKELSIVEKILCKLKKQSEQPQKYYLMHYYEWKIDKKKI